MYSANVASSPPTELQADLDDATVRNYAIATAVGWLAVGALHAAAGRWLTALVHLGAALGSASARLLVRGERGRFAGIIVLAAGSLAGLAGVAVLSGDSRGPAVTLIALVPLLSGVIRTQVLRRSILALSIATAIGVPVVASRVTVVEPMRLGVLESVLLSAALGVLVYRFGSEWRLRSDAHVARLKAQQAELEAQRVRLETSASELEKVRDEALRASAAKSQFVAMTSHEIRGPLNGLVGLSHALADTELSAHQRGIVQALRGSSDALTKVVGELLDLARVEAGRIELAVSSVDVRELVEDVVDTFSAGTMEKELEIAAVTDASVPEGVLVDGSRLRQIVANLVGNAAKFTDRGHVLVRARFVSGMLVVVVSDTGRGISSEDRARLFAPFEQVSDRLLDRQAGTGLGLWLARSFVEAMGGVLEVRSELGAGTTFELRVPCRRVTVPELDRPSRLPTSNVLALVSSPIAADSFSCAATRVGLAPTVVASGEPLPASGVFEHVFVDVDDPVLIARIDEAARLCGPGGRTYLAASPRRVARAEELMRRHDLAGVLLKPFRAARLAALADLGGDPHARGRVGSASGQILPGDLLVVDDEPINRTVARHLAEGMGLSVWEAASGPEALAWLERNPCDVVLLDLHMEGTDGAETARRIRAVHGGVPILIGYSGLVRDEERARFLAAGVTEVLGKPLERSSFESALRTGIHRARRRRTLTKERPGAAGACPSAKVTAPAAAADGPPPASGATTPPTSGTTLDRARLRDLERFVGVVEARKLASEFLASFEARVRNVTESASAAHVAAEAHKLASVAGTFGMSDVAAACLALEAAAPRSDAAELETLVARLRAAAPRARSALAGALDESPPA